VGEVLSDPRGAALTRALLAGAATSPEIRQLMDEYWAVRLSAISAIVYRAIDRGAGQRTPDRRSAVPPCI
jgi:Tetracyclin repressor-like, C-terminal domain